MGDINQFYAGLDSIFAEGRIREVEGYCLQWKEDAERGGDAQGVIAACNELGGFYRAQGKLPEAEVLYLRVLAELRRNGLDKTENYATALINLGTVHIVGQEIEKAYKVYQEAEEILTALGFWKDYRMAALNNSLSAVYREMGRLNDAENCSRKALDIIVDYPDKRGELATTYVNLGEVQTAQGKFEIARENLERAISIFEKETGGKDVHYATAMAAMGGLAYQEGKLSQAKEYYEQAKALTERDFGKNLNYERICDAINQIHQAMARS